MAEQDKILQDVTQSDYKYGFVTNIETDIIEKGLNETVVRTIWEKKKEPDFMLDFRLDAFRKWQKMKMPDWAYLKIPPIDFQAISYYAAPVQKPKYTSIDEVDPELIETFNKLGIPLEEQKVLAGLAV